MHTPKLLIASVVTASCVIGGLAGCASTPVPREQLAVSQASIEAAQSAGAGEFAPVELNRARDKFTQAQLAVKEDQLLKAKRLAEQAAADAQVARSKANAERAQRAAKEVSSGINVLRREIDQSTDSTVSPSMPAPRP